MHFLISDEMSGETLIVERDLLRRWLSFGSNGHIKEPPSVAEHFTKRSTRA